MKVLKAIKNWERRWKNTRGQDLSTPKGRREAALHAHLADYAFLRRFWTNTHPVADGIWRSNQPGRDRFDALAERGFKTILNLRGQTLYSTVLFEQEACDRLGIKLITLDLDARALAPAEDYLHLLDILQQEKRPLLMHCKSGADRTGLAAALYLLDQGVPFTQAQHQLSFKYLHRRSSATGVLDELLEEYQRFCQSKPIPIREWLKSHYDRDEITARFQAAR